MKIFVYGSLMKNFFNHHQLVDSKFIIKTITKEKYHMFSMGAFPAVVESIDTGHIYGELYEVDDSTLAKIDALESNGSFYERRKVSLVDVDEPVWMYFIMHSDDYKTNSDNIIVMRDIMMWQNFN